MSTRNTTKGLVVIGRIGLFKPLKPGKIHMKCGRCKNTRSNMDRSDFDPANAAVLVLNYCPRCEKGGGFEETFYYDDKGDEINSAKEGQKAKDGDAAWAERCRDFDRYLTPANDAQEGGDGES